MHNNRFLNRGLFGLLFMGLMAHAAFAQSKTSTDAYEISNEDLKEYVGQYDPEGGQFFSITISIQGEEKLMAQPTDKRQPLTLLAATAKDKFNLVGPPINITFNRDDAGKIISLTFAQGGNSFKAIRKEE